MWNRIVRWDRRLMGLPGRGLLFLGICIGAWAALRLLPFLWPFGLAFLFSRMLEPFVRLLTKGRLRLGRRLAAALGTLLLLSVAVLAAGGLIAFITRQLSELAKALPQTLNWVSDTAIPAVEELYQRYRDVLPAFLPRLLENALSQLGQSALRLAGSLSALLTSGAWSTAAALPNGLLGLMCTLMGTYYLTADRSRIGAFFHRSLPPNWLERWQGLRRQAAQTLLCQLRGEMLVSLWVAGFLAAGMLLFRVRFALLAAVGIALADGLPIVGAGLFLIPWSLLAFLGGDSATGVLMACLYVGAVLIRQFLEPRIVGRQLGLYPLVSLAALFVGYRLAGVAGLIGAPLLCSLFQAVLDTAPRH